jgi:hypothetical protein
MSKFLVTYFGGGMPADPAEAAAAVEAFGQWVARTGKSIVDPGAPLKPGAQVAKGTPAPKVAIGGYSVIDAPTVEAALEILRSHPFVARGGTLQVDEALSL